jgi:hypothetical protein
MTQSTEKPEPPRRLRRGDLVMVYQKPYTSEAKEGQAFLRKKIEGEDRWLVQFPPDSPDDLYERVVLPEHRLAP